MDFMQEAIKQARIAGRRGEVPIGCVIVKDGKIIRGAMGRLIRDGEVVADTEISALKIVKDDKAEVNTGFECGIKLADIPDLKEGDIIECYELVPIKRK